MILYYSGSSTYDNIPEHVLQEEEPGVMLTYWEMEGEGRKKDTVVRFENHCARRKEKRLTKKKEQKNGRGE